jgi:hypothetical protein
VVVGVFEAAFLCARDGRAEGGEDDDVVGVFLEDVAGAFLEGGGHVGVAIALLWQGYLDLACLNSLKLFV